jgi:alpha-1,3-rhamnosyl/mannosyltransferase
MRLIVDATPLLLRSAGVKTYVYQWTEHLRRTAGPHSLRLFPFVGTPAACPHDRSVAGLLRTVAGIATLHGCNYLGSWAGWPAAGRADVFHASHQLRRPPRAARLTATLYDMTCWVAPGMHTEANVRASHRFAEMVLRRADGLIAISENTRRDALRMLSLDPGRVTVIYPGVAQTFFTAKAPAPARPYALSVGTIEPRKNIGTLLEAWSQLPTSFRDEYDLVLAGPPGWGDQSLLARLEAGIPGVRYLGYIPEADLPTLTAGATLFVYPSLYEGFGLPVAQAMAAGVPVVTSNNSALPEVAGEGALLVDPKSPAELREALQRLLASPTLRQDLGRRAAAKAQRYRWEEAAKQTWKWMEKIAG